jgi:hypothetical protein
VNSFYHSPGAATGDRCNPSLKDGNYLMPVSYLLAWFLELLNRAFVLGCKCDFIVGRRGANANAIALIQV